MKDKKPHNKKEFSLKDIQKTGFNKPQNYLDSFENDLFAKISEDSLPNTHGFKVPNTYFNSLEDTISSRIHKETREPKVIRFSHTIRKIVPLAAAASVLLFIGLNYFSTVQNAVTIDDLSETEIENWLYAANNSIDITNELQLADFEETSIADNINDLEIEDYLDNIDTSTLLNEIN